jgi:DNA-directed RNA polymerase specialized sigma24 family protein
LSGRVTHGKWALTQPAFDKLLYSFSPDRQEAARQFEQTRIKLIRFFEWHATDSPEERADETFNRAARRIYEGEQIDNLIGYLYGIAHFVFKEALKERERAPLPLETAERKVFEAPVEDEEREQRLRCLDTCLKELASDDRLVILGYYQEEKRAKIEFRKQMADRLGIGLNALRIRAYRIRAKLENCLIQCLGQAPSN